MFPKGYQDYYGREVEPNITLSIPNSNKLCELHLGTSEISDRTSVRFVYHSSNDCSDSPYAPAGLRDEANDDSLRYLTISEAHPFILGPEIPVALHASLKWFMSL
jgi:hypothetical protein